MNILILSGYKNRPDEGLKKIAFYLEKKLIKDNNVKHLNMRENLLSFKFWRDIKIFNPDVIIIVLRGSVLTLLIAKLLKIWNKTSKLILITPQPLLNERIIKLTPIRYLVSNGIDIVIVQSFYTKEQFDNLEFKTVIFPVGVDIKKFRPLKNKKDKLKLRKKYGIPSNKIVLLHVGHINKGRNLCVLKEFCNKSTIEQIIVGSTNEFNFDKTIYKELLHSGCRVIRRYIENIEEIYQLSDIYVFPTDNPNFVIEQPLSVLEAMACNILVVTVKLRALKYFIPEKWGVIFVNSPNEIKEAVFKMIYNPKFLKKVRCAYYVRNYSWEALSKRIQRVIR